MSEKIKVMSPEGWIWEGLTFEQSLLLHDRFARQAQPSPPPVSQPTQSETAPSNLSGGTFECLAELLAEPKHGMELRLLTLVADHPKGVSTATLRRVLQIDTNGAFGARLGGIGRISKRAGVNKALILLKTGVGKTAVYHPGKMLLDHIADLPQVPAP